ncbi:autoinducer binding domain-containing protein [Piscinibacter sp.]|uniref:autoinducer binding domain-containing protein n=1 Tax=Piscinibacter sp. TaxID=1903157 RepID=UPI002ED5266E
MVLSEFTAVLSATDRVDLQREVVRFATWLGFDKVCAAVAHDRPGREPEFLTVHNTPAAYMPTFLDLSRARVDPVMQHCKRSPTPIAWDQATYVAADKGEMWEHQAAFGYCSGVVVAMHFGAGRHFFVGMDRDQSLPTCPADLSRMVADLQLFAVHAQDAAFRILRPESACSEVPQLTARELDVLRWTIEGKTAWEVGRILAISEQTAARHINNAAQKLGCVNKLQAALRAIQLGLLS